MSTFGPIFAQSIWSLNDAQIVSNMKGVMKNSNIIGIKLLDEEDQFSKAFGIVRNHSGQTVRYSDVSNTENYLHYDSQFTQIYENSRPVTYTSQTRGTQVIATLVLYSNSDAVLAEVSDTFAVTIASALLKTLFLWIIAVFILKRRISQPLYIITEGIERLTPILGTKKDKPEDEKISHLSDDQDELARLLGTFTKMKIALIAKETEVLNYQRHLEDANRALEDKVQARTKELEQVNSKLRKLSVTDALTGLKNRRYFDETLNKEFKRANRNHQQLSLLIADIDHFKQFNDTYGHDIGDEVLSEVAKVMEAKIMRETDLLARFGGEEFAILLPSTDEEGAYHVAENVRHAVESYGFYVESRRVPITISIGIATVESASSQDTKSLFKQADSALYTAKRNGRNRTSRYCPDPDNNEQTAANR
jgi:diguanylate cyclase (GGDEF)-like protein